MVEFLPFLLILLGWEAASPGETMTLAVVLTADEASCRDQGDALVAQRCASGAEGMDYRFFCSANPSADEYDRVFEQLR